MRHTTCRRRLSEQAADGLTPSAEITSHLAGCADCSAYAARLDSVMSAAPALGGSAPSELASSIATAVKTADASTLTELPDDPTPDTEASVRRLPTRSLRSLVIGAAAAVVVAVGAAALIPAGDDEAVDLRAASPIAALESAVAAAESTDTYRFDVSGSTEFRLEIGDLADHLELPDIPMPDISMPDITFPDLDRGLREAFGSRLDEFERVLGTLPEQFSTDPRNIDLDYEFAGSGEVVRPDRAHVQGSVSGAEPAIGPVEVIRVGDELFASAGDGWIRLRSGNPPLPAPVFDPESALGALRDPVGPVEDLGVETLAGVEVRHLRFGATLTETGIGGSALHAVDVWIDSDDQLRKIRLRHDHATPDADTFMSVSFRSDVSITLYDFGADVEIDPPPADQVRDGDLPFGFGIDFDG